jgi:hypothetical protein
MIFTAVFSWGQVQQDTEERFLEPVIAPFQWGKLILIGLFFMGIGVSITLGHVFFQGNFSEATTQQLLVEYEESAYQTQPTLTVQDLRNFVEDDSAIVVEGRVLFPTYLRKNGGFQSVFAPAFDEQSYNRLVFYVTGNQGISGSIHLDASPKEFPGFTDAIVFGCYAEGRWGDYLDVLAVVLKSELATVYVRSSLPDQLTCPLPPP